MLDSSNHQCAPHSPKTMLIFSPALQNLVISGNQRSHSNREQTDLFRFRPDQIPDRKHPLLIRLLAPLDVRLPHRQQRLNRPLY